MKSTNKLTYNKPAAYYKSKACRKMTAFLLAFGLTVGLCGCGASSFEAPYEANSSISSFNVIAKTNPGLAVPFASNLCIVTQDITDAEKVNLEETEAAALFDLNNSQVLFSQNAHERLYPASLTKVLTALVALENGSLDQTLTASDAVNITKQGAQLCGLKSGDKMTLDQALHALLMYSANDAAMMIADNIGGSVDHFMEMMNEKAAALGATNTHFTNPHGLPDEEHYTTVYDLYLMFNAAAQNETFREIINLPNYQTTYYDKDGNTRELKFRNTNAFVRGDYKAPDNVTIIGGKTGTTDAAGHCLVLYVKDAAGAPYISIILRAKSSDTLYPQMVDLLDEIGK